ncbi:DNA-damage-inducible protein J [Clostridia bacterium]|nr:DNA-damage-inducible protein J [Clostridia bacterium]
MKETTNLSIRIDKELKKQAEVLFSELGLTLTAAFIIFTRQAVRQGAIPFKISLNVPNEETVKVIQEVENMINGKIPSNSMTVSEFAQEMERHQQ